MVVRCFTDASTRENISVVVNRIENEQFHYVYHDIDNTTAEVNGVITLLDRFKGTVEPVQIYTDCAKAAKMATGNPSITIIKIKGHARKADRIDEIGMMFRETDIAARKILRSIFKQK